MQVLNPGRASEGRGGRSWKFIVGGIRLDGVRKALPEVGTA